MNNKKWYNIVFLCLLSIVLLPWILLGLLICGMLILLQIPREKKEYKKSEYYNDFPIPYHLDILNDKKCRFYHAAKKSGLPMHYVRQESNAFEYFIYEDILYVFPDFTQITFAAEKETWEVNRDGDWICLEEYYQTVLSFLDDTAPKIPVKIAVERDLFLESTLEHAEIPDCIHLTVKYETIFANGDSARRIRFPQNTSELYDMMLGTPDLCGTYELVNDTIAWRLYKNISVEISVANCDCYIGIAKAKLGKMTREITHWHPDRREIYPDVCSIGCNGHILVIRENLFGTTILYKGDSENCPYPPLPKRRFGKIYYLKAESFL